MRSFKILLKILRTVGIFLLIVCLLSGLLIAHYLRGENFYYQDARERDAQEGKITYVVTGASYALFGIRTDVISERSGVNCYSLSGTLMTLRGRYALLKKELDRNKGIHTVIIEVSPDTLLRDRQSEGPKGDLPMLARLTDPAERWDYFRAAFPVREWPEVYYDMVSKGVDCAIRSLRGEYTTENRIRGFYENFNPDKPIPTNYGAVWKSQRLPETVNEENVEWLERIVRLCTGRCERVYLISTPQSRYYNCAYNNLDFYQSWFTQFAEEHGIPYFNFNLHRDKIRLLPDATCFYDETHLNNEGGKIFTTMMLSVLNAYTGNHQTDYLFYPSYRALDWEGYE